jgi:hypothetical protein
MDDGLGLDSGRKDIITLHGGGVLETHGPSQCAGENCCIHAPSDHPLRDAPLCWIRELNLMMRICPHGHPHPDPDSVAFLRQYRHVSDWHPCCGDHCCGLDGSTSLEGDDNE